MDKELKKLEDLEWEYNTAKMLKKEKEIIDLAYHKFKRQLDKVVEMQKTERKEKK